ncbi:DPM/DPG synthase family glycosyltransferase [Lacticaseibacillus paracasei]|uniref:DPM/DPG synthase family glycosyltransferase n=1 Tax=Lacticaseibacillus paracasei TaxID=1597 RepID=UPI000F0B857C|nr:DPM/DPG synthase family glycosyltransferase [Lacticaseibacillus paracasei]RND51686.1 putative glucosyl-3-phosphoglycerate synthase [Lacticaseibacillus paracasei]
MKIAVLIPCYNEALTIEKVVKDFKHELPDATIYVYDNNSSDDTGKIAMAAGAVVRPEPRQGKGLAVRQMFFDIEADYYIMVDGDDTYPAEAVHSLLSPLVQGMADMTIGDRLSNGTYYKENKRKFHDFGNNLVRNSINFLYKSQIRDVMTGYRGFTRIFVKSLPVTSNGYQIETELTIHALDRRFKLVEIPITYRDRPRGSFSKLNTISDGIKVIFTIIRMVKDSRPMMFFGSTALFFFLLGLIAGIPVITEFFTTHYVKKIPSAIFATGTMVFALMLLITGFILDTVVKQDKKNYELYLYQLYSEKHMKTHEG